MLKINLPSLMLICILFSGNSFAQHEVVGLWECLNDEGRVNSIIEIFKEKDNEIGAKVIRITKEEDRDKLCTGCEGALKNHPVEGLQIIKGLSKVKDEVGTFAGGEIINPESGKSYKVKIWISQEDPDQLQLRAYAGLLYKTMTWRRAKKTKEKTKEVYLTQH